MLLNRLKLFLLVLILESAGAAGVLALNVTPVPGAQFFGYGRFHFLLLLGMLAVTVILAVVTFLFWKQISMQSKVGEWFEALRNNPGRYRWAVVISSAGAILSSLLLLSGIFILKDYQSIVMQVLPIAIFIVLALFELLILLVLEPNNSGKYVWIGRSVLLILLCFLMLSYLRGAFDFSKWVNRTPDQGGVSDQIVYMKMMAAAHQSPLTYIGDGNRMPLFPLIEAIFYNPQAAYQDSFDRAKAVNIYLSILVLAGLFIFFQKSWKSLFTSVNLVLIAAFGVFIFKSAYFTTEVVYYFFGFLSFVFLAVLFVRPTYKNAIAAGVFTSLAYLSKASTLASVAFFALVWCFAVLVGWLGRPKAEGSAERGDAFPRGAWERGESAWERGKPGKLLLIGGTAVVVFLGLLIPFGVQNSQKYGGFFSNINSNVVMWTDSYGQYKVVANKYGGLVKMLKTPVPDQPSLQTYVRTHSFQQVLRRFSNGFAVQLHNVLYPFNAINYPLVLIIVLAAVAGIYYKRTWELLIRYKAVSLFVMCYLLGYFVLFCWYGVIDKGPRFVLGLFLPLLFSIYTALYQYKDKLVLGIKQFSILNAINVLLVLLICVDSYIVLSSYLMTGQFGF
jgi:hypothetical protein